MIIKTAILGTACAAFMSFSIAGFAKICPKTVKGLHFETATYTKISKTKLLPGQVLTSTRNFGPTPTQYVGKKISVGMVTCKYKKGLLTLQKRFSQVTVFKNGTMWKGRKCYTQYRQHCPFYKVK